MIIIYLFVIITLYIIINHTSIWAEKLPPKRQNSNVKSFLC